MMRELVIGLDAGTSMIKAVAFTCEGDEVATSERANRHETTPDGGATMDMERVWRDCGEVLRELVDQLDPLRDRPAALGVTAQGDGTVLIDDDNELVGEALLWLDRRSAGWVSGFIGGDADRARLQATGTGITACQQGAQLNWMREAMPGVLSRARTAFHCKDWIYLRLTGEQATDPSEASFSYGNFRTRDYDDTAIAALGLEDLRSLFPPIVDGATTTHPLTKDGATATGLPVGLPVSLGYLDAACTALGAGVHEDGEGFGCSILGSTGVHLKGTLAADVVINDDSGGYVLLLPLPGRVAQMQTNMSGSLNLDWVMALGRDLVSDYGNSAPDLMGRLEDWLNEDAGPPPLYHPYISTAGERGPFVNSDARAGFTGLHSGHGYADLVRGVVEGLAMAARDCYTAMGGVPPEIRLSGGAARSAGVRRIMGEVLGSPVRRALREETGAAGAAMIAAVATRMQPDMESCIKIWVTPRLGSPEIPDGRAIRARANRFSAYRLVRESLPPAWAALASTANLVPREGD
jgi:erythritol kinase